MREAHRIVDHDHRRGRSRASTDRRPGPHSEAGSRVRRSLYRCGSGEPHPETRWYPCSELACRGGAVPWRDRLRRSARVGTIHEARTHAATRAARAVLPLVFMRTPPLWSVIREALHRPNRRAAGVGILGNGETRRIGIFRGALRGNPLSRRVCAARDYPHEKPIVV